MLNFKDYQRAYGLYEQIIEKDSCDYNHLIHKDVVNFSINKTLKDVEDYIITLRGILLSHIIKEVDKDKNEIVSECRKILANKLNDLNELNELHNKCNDSSDLSKEEKEKFLSIKYEDFRLFSKKWFKINFLRLMCKLKIV